MGASVNVPIVGASMTSFIDFLVDNGAHLDSFHLMGFSMGAHVVGIAGSSITKGKLARITGLDPSVRVFQDLDATKRLDAGDALFVDVIHTNKTLTPMGHVDFYPNGGDVQPGCAETIPRACCDHCRVVSLMAESITTDVGFRSLQCDSYENFQNGVCNENNSVLMGNPVPNATQGRYYLDTNSISPYARG